MVRTPTGVASLLRSGPQRRPSILTRSTSPSTMCGSAVAAQPPRTRPLSTCPIGTSRSASICMPDAQPPWSGPTTSPPRTCTRTRRTRHERAPTRSRRAQLRCDLRLRMPPDGGMSPARGHAALSKAQTLVEALPWLARLHGRTVVIKYGGHAMSDDALREAFAEDLVFLRYAGIKPVIVHGGGPQITEHLERLGVPIEFAGGLRVT